MTSGEWAGNKGKGWMSALLMVGPWHLWLDRLAHIHLPFFFLLNESIVISSSSKHNLPMLVGSNLHSFYILFNYQWLSSFAVSVLCCAKLCLTLCNPVGCSPPGSSVHGILQARILEWVAMASSRGSSQPRDQTHIPCISCTAGGCFTCWATREAQNGGRRAGLNQLKFCKASVITEAGMH